MSPPVVKHISSNGKTYYLHGMQVALKNDNGTYPIYYFSPREDYRWAVSEYPAGYETVESPRNGLPLLRKVR